MSALGCDQDFVRGALRIPAHPCVKGWSVELRYISRDAICGSWYSVIIDEWDVIAMITFPTAIQASAIFKVKLIGL